MSPKKPQRFDRLISVSTNPDEYRSEFERDHDRIIYSSSFRRLAGVTQVVNPSEGQIFHNRLTHSIKVAQIGRRIAEKLLKDYTKRKLLPLGGIDPSVVEAAALAHDLGNPPFGHIGESELNTLVKGAGVIDGFEGNAQSFRIVNKLSFGYAGHPGLNLTRATLNAVLKYPWMFGENKEIQNKFGAYRTEANEFNWARSIVPKLGQVRTLEAALMDLADDITYAIHDCEDFYRANLIPLAHIASDIDKYKLIEIVKQSKETWFPPDEKIDPQPAVEDLLRNLEKATPIKSRFEGRIDERIGIHSFSSSMINRFVHDVKVNYDFEKFRSPILLSKEQGVEIIVLKYITRSFVIEHPSLIRQQYGESKIINFLFTELLNNIENNRWIKVFPMIGQQRLQKPDISLEEKVRIVADTISNMTDIEAIRLYSRLNGMSPGSIFEYLIT